MEYKKLSLGGYNLHLIKTDKFKSCHVEVIFRNNVDICELSKRKFLTKILCESNASYPTRRKLILRFEDLYNASCYGFTSKVGNSIISNFCADFLSPEYTEDNMPEETIKLLFDLIFKPLVKNREFDSKTFELIKNQMIDSINRIKENPRRMAINNAFKYLGDTPSAYNSLGTLKDIEEITPENLYETYEKMLQNDYVDIFVLGNLDMDKISDYIIKNANFKIIKNHDVTMYVDNPKMKEKYVKDKIVAAQTNIVMILNLSNLSIYEKNYVANIYNMILGGGSLHTKLYERLRNENSLCYSVNSYYQKYDGLVIVTTAVDTNAEEKAIKLVKQSLKDMINNITDKELNEAKEAVITSLNYIKDDIDRLIDNYYYESIGQIDDVETRLKTFKNVTIDDIYSFAKKVSVGIVYTLDGGNNE